MVASKARKKKGPVKRVLGVKLTPEDIQFLWDEARREGVVWPARIVEAMIRDRRARVTRATA